MSTANQNPNALSHEERNAHWSSKLVGKKIGDQSDRITFAKQALPDDHRVLAPGSAATRDYKEDRLNVYVDGDGIVERVYFG